MIIFDLETQKLAHEVGGWGNIAALQMSVGVTWDERHGYQIWWEAQAGDLIKELENTDLIVGFNLTKFDFAVLSLYASTEHLTEHTFDILDHINRELGHRVSLSKLAKLNLGITKLLDSGAGAVKLWREQDLVALTEYCIRDVELTRTLLETWQDTGVLRVSDANWLPFPGDEIQEVTRHDSDTDESA